MPGPCILTGAVSMGHIAGTPITPVPIPGVYMGDSTKVFVEGRLVSRMAVPASAPSMFPMAMPSVKSLWQNMPALLMPAMSMMPAANVNPIGAVISGMSTKVIVG